MTPPTPRTDERTKPARPGRGHDADRHTARAAPPGDQTDTARRSSGPVPRRRAQKGRLHGLIHDEQRHIDRGIYA
ncbi:MAG: hypothetical protein IPJ48_11095 [Propionivibrio sp.]|uniref:Uncharacterized protein n=1 Tax=Candidatus Propionivibrio dominans TaxID=2954373 RepID=A0A9D7FBX5_9RHOO|nr:hypothetical protein [Candidatus Propionivibrio dominans]